MLDLLILFHKFQGLCLFILFLFYLSLLFRWMNFVFLSDLLLVAFVIYTLLLSPPNNFLKICYCIFQVKKFNSAFSYNLYSLVEIFYFVLYASREFEMDSWSSFMMASVKSLSGNSNMWFLSVFLEVDYLFSFKFWIFLILVMKGNSWIYAGHFVYCVRRLWFLFISFIWVDSHLVLVYHVNEPSLIGYSSSSNLIYRAFMVLFRSVLFLLCYCSSHWSLLMLTKVYVWEGRMNFPSPGFQVSLWEEVVWWDPSYQCTLIAQASLGRTGELQAIKNKEASLAKSLDMTDSPLLFLPPSCTSLDGRRGFY